MKKFLGNCCIFGFVALVCILLVFVYRYIKLHGRADSVFSLKEGQHILVLGDSHAENSFLEKPDNGIKMLTYSGSPINVSLMRLLELEKRTNLSGIDVCAVNFCYTYILEWSYKFQIESAWRLLPFAFRYLDLLPIRRVDAIRRLADFTSQNINELPPLATDFSQKLDRGVPITEHSEEWVREQLDDALGRHFRLRESQPDLFVPNMADRVRETFTAFKEVCDRHAIRLIFYSSPLSKEYREGIPHWAKEEFEGLLDEVRGLGIEYYDFMGWGDRALLRDSDHLNKSGAEAFTKMFCDDVIQKSRTSTLLPSQD